MVFLKIVTIILVSICFCSALYFFILRIRLYRFLLNRSVRVSFGLAGLPGYLENLYHSSGSNIRNSVGNRLIYHIKLSLGIALSSGISAFLISRYLRL
jgi:hypothetical protein